MDVISVSREQVAAKNEREEKLVFSEQRSADVAVKVVSEVVRQVSQTAIQLLGLGTNRQTVRKKRTEPH